MLIGRCEREIKILAMKSYFLSVLLVLCSVALFSFTEGENEGKIEWLTIEEAEKRAETEPRAIFVDVYTSWCGWCKVMDRKTFANPEVVKYVNEHYYAVKMNAEDYDKFEFNGQNTNNAELARVFRVSGYPTIVLINEDFTEFTPRAGFRGPSDFIKLLKSYKENTQAKR